MLRCTGYYSLALFFAFSSAIPQTDCGRIPKREVRAVWITTVGGLDWPKSQDPAQQKLSLHQMVVNLKAAHFNTIFFQVRGRGDAMYRSNYVPWSEQLAGTLGKDPGWDPLAFLLDEAHKQGMEVHAWFNTFLLKTGKQKPPESTIRHLILQRPEWTHLVDGDWWLDPGLPSVRSYLVDVGMEIVRHYDIDGFHFDYIRYPGNLFPDEAAYKRYGKQRDKEDWRRVNIDQFVRTFYDSAIALKPMLKIGSAPIGIYTNISGTNGRQGYSELYQDSREWLREGKHDYVAPQVYWALGNKPGNPDFGILAKDWSRNSFGRQVYIGVGAYKPEVHNQIAELIDSTRCAGAEGNSFFRYEHIADMTGIGMRYRYPANVPPMPWKDSIPPGTPRNLIVTNLSDGIFELRWDRPVRAADGDSAVYFDIYRSVRKPIDVQNPENLLSITSSAMTRFVDTIEYPVAAKYYYAVTAFDKGNNESAPTTETGVLIPAVAELSRQYIPAFKLGDYYPDPASKVVFVSYTVEKSSPVLLKILDAANREVLGVVDAVEAPGRYVAAADISQLKNGVYSYLLVAGELSVRRTLRVDN